MKSSCIVYAFTDAGFTIEINQSRKGQDTTSLDRATSITRSDW